MIWNRAVLDAVAHETIEQVRLLGGSVSQFNRATTFDAAQPPSDTFACDDRSVMSDAGIDDEGTAGPIACKDLHCCGPSWFSSSADCC